MLLSSTSFLLTFASLITLSSALPTQQSYSELNSFSIPRSPSGLFFDEHEASLLYVLCGTQTNGDHYLYAFTTDGDEQCLITIPQSVGMSRVDGFYIIHETQKAFIVDSQGPIYADRGLGGSVYEVEWTNPCGCQDGSCSESNVEWSPTVTNQWALAANDVSSSEGGGNDEYFRNSGIVVVDNSFYGVNGVHPVGGSLSGSYTKSVVQVDMSTSNIINHWPFDASTIGREIDMEGLTCGPDQCSTSLFIGDEYNWIYQLDLASGEVTKEWDLGEIVNVNRADKGIEALTYASTTGYFYAGIQDTARIHVVQLEGVDTDVVVETEEVDNGEEATEANVGDGDSDSAPSEGTSAQGSMSFEISSPQTESDMAMMEGDSTMVNCNQTTEDYPQCYSSIIPMDQKRIRREIRSLSMEEWDRVVTAMWAMKTTDKNTGKSMYGDAFRTYDYFVVKHAVATTDSRGDQAHFGSHFITWHLALVLEFENALLAIDPEIKAMPYWDECKTEPSVFTNDYFGVDPTEFPFEVTTGKFSKWPVDSNFSITDWSDYITDSSTVTFNGGGDVDMAYLRGEENAVTNAFAVRYGSGSRWESSLPATCNDNWWSCTSAANAGIGDWYHCVEGGTLRTNFHSGPHATIGGRGERIGPGEAMTRGDFEDPMTSPNGPLFMFHHANLDRSRLWWMQRKEQMEESCNYFGFPVHNASYISGRDSQEGGNAFEGAHLNDYLSDAWGFTYDDLGIGTAVNSTDMEMLTHADILCWLNPESAPYTYDTNLDCLTNNTKCNNVQLLEGMEDESQTVVDQAVSKTITETKTETENTAGAKMGASRGTTTARWFATALMAATVSSFFLL